MVLMNDGLILLPQSLYLRRRRQSLKTMCSDSCIEILMYVLGAQPQLGIASLAVQRTLPQSWRAGKTDPLPLSFHPHCLLQLLPLVLSLYCNGLCWVGSVCSSQPPQMFYCNTFLLYCTADPQGPFSAEVSHLHFLLFSLQLHPGLLPAALSSAVWSQLRELRGSDGVLPAAGVGEHPLLHPRLPAHRHLQRHDPEGQGWGKTSAGKGFGL